MMDRCGSLGRWCVVAMLVAPMLVGCGDATSGDIEHSRWTSSDESFVARMIPHHHLGMVLIDEATSHSGDVRLRRLVFEMHGYHMSDLTTLETWSDERSITLAIDFPGELATDEVDALARYDGVSHDILWLDLMIRHHEGAVTIADEELSGGAANEVRAMAAETRRVQSDEIDRMKALLTDLCAEPYDSAVASSCR